MATTNLHESMVKLASRMVPEHIEQEPDDTTRDCFNRFTFLEALEQRLESQFADDDGPAGRFQLDSTAIARYLWCCLAIQAGDHPAGTKFRGMDILD